MALDERLRRAIDRAGEPADPSGVYERLISRHERRRLVRSVRAGGLTLIVVLGAAIGVIALSRVFSGTTGGDVAGTGVSKGRIAFVMMEEVANGHVGSTISSMNVDGSDRSRLAEIPGHVSGLDWSPDGTRLAFVASTEAEGDSVFIMNQDGSDVRRVIGTTANADVSWSPDGTRLAYLDEWRNTVALFVVGLEGGERQRLTGQDQYVATPDWSPDGRSIAVASKEPHTEPELWDIYVFDVSTSVIDQLTEHPALDLEPQWSPDGTEILFRSRRDDVPGTPAGSAAPDEIYVMRADGSNQTRLTFDKAIDQWPIWAPDGTEIAYTSQTPQQTTIVIMNADGSDPRAFAFDGSAIAWQPLVGTDGAEPSPTPSPSETTAPSPIPEVGVDIDVGFPVCNVSSIEGRFVTSDTNATIFVAMKASDAAGCPQPEEAFNIVALDSDQDGVADTSYGPAECTLECRAFSAPDIDGDGTDELLVVQDGGAVVGLRLYDVVTSDGELAVVPVNVAEPGDPESGLMPGKQARFVLGGDAFELYTLLCGNAPPPEGPGVIATAAESLPHDSPSAEWHAHETTLVLRSDGLLHVVDVRDFTEPVTDDPDGPSFQSGETLCGSNLGPVVPIP